MTEETCRFKFVIMNMQGFILIGLLGILVTQSAFCQSAHKLLRQGDRAYSDEQYDAAEERYRKSIDKKFSAKGVYNLGNSIYEQDRFEEAVSHYEQAVQNTGDDVSRAEALYNLGNAQLQSGQLEDAISSYKDAIRLNPGDDDFRQNLYKAKLLRREQQQQQQEQQQESQQDNQENSDEQEQSQQQQQQQDQGENQEENQQSSSADIDNEGGDTPQPEETQELSKEDAEKLLQVIENEEKNVQEKLRKLSSNKKKPKKDW